MHMAYEMHHLANGAITQTLPTKLWRIGGSSEAPSRTPLNILL